VRLIALDGPRAQLKLGDPKANMLSLQILSTEGRVVRLCREHFKPRGSKGLNLAPLRSCLSYSEVGCFLSVDGNRSVEASLEGTDTLLADDPSQRGEAILKCAAVAKNAGYPGETPTLLIVSEAMQFKPPFMLY
jgi:hypothetical protein